MQLDSRDAMPFPGPSMTEIAISSFSADQLRFAPASVESFGGESFDLGAPSSQRLELRISRPEAVSVPLPRPRVRVTGFLFPDGLAARRRLESAAAPAVANEVVPKAVPATKPSAPAATRTRIQPPRDVVKLEDRLYYLLQPPLENLLSLRSLSFPFRPFPYQMDGIAFLYPRHQAVLADEMGLGKTMQAVTALRLLVSQGQIRRALLVCPKPLVTNWQREFSLWAPELPVTVVEGDQPRRQWLWQNAIEGVLLANYESVVRDRRVVAAAEPAFDVMVLDESQRIKNRSSTTNQVICSVPRHRSWALTGTPIENSTEDLVGIFQFVSPGCLSPKMKTAPIRSAVSDYVCRRTKDEVLDDLPPKIYRDAKVILTPEQRQSYQLAESQGVVRLNEMRGELTIQHVFELVLRLKQICNFDPLTGTSAKFDRLKADLEECAASGRKAIVFSQWVQTIRRLSEGLAEFGPLEYHGQIPSKKRDGVIEQFRDDPSCHVLLMSYGAGSVGLNLQFASYVFLYDRWWNPAVEDQAINRAHRLGSTAPVTITRMLASGTIEERIDRVLEEKRELFHSVFGAGGSTGRTSLSREEIFGLFDLKFPEPPQR